MDTDLMLTLGAGLLILAMPSLLAAFADRRPPRMGAVLVIIGGALVVLAVSQNPGGYRLADLPEAAINTIGRYLR